MYVVLTEVRVFHTGLRISTRYPYRVLYSTSLPPRSGRALKTMDFIVLWQAFTSKDPFEILELLSLPSQGQIDLQIPVRQATTML